LTQACLRTRYQTLHRTHSDCVCVRIESKARKHGHTTILEFPRFQTSGKYDKKQERIVIDKHTFN